ncbi:hypothetical protein N8I77_009651 [Diaporthe amygdali]|uniref:Uncharacterized protein n=1 Tax=Phomopsis amygdali TaxID=1214568 RepID=A0AAD9SD26_PHOAM|nr:hypothetical protein N8I77_009651 [Diaporthe amygdali]
MSSLWATATARQLWNFTSYVDIENTRLRPNGQVLMTTFTNASLYTLDPTSSSPTAELVASFSPSTALTGMATVGKDKFAVIGGVRGSYMYTNETVYTCDFSAGSEPAIEVVATLPDAVMLNGMDSLPRNPAVVLIADSRVGAVWRVNTTDGNVTIAYQGDLLLPPENATVPIGINGLKISSSYVYFTNTAKNLFARIAVTDDGVMHGEVETVAILAPGEEDYDWDDFIIDASGEIAYMAQSPNAVGKVIIGTGEMDVVVGEGNDTSLIGPTSVTLAEDGVTAYVSTRGTQSSGISGQLVEISLA